jgi:hypothetical protein
MNETLNDSNDTNSYLGNEVGGASRCGEQVLFDAENDEKVEHWRVWVEWNHHSSRRLVCKQDAAGVSHRICDAVCLKVVRECRHDRICR